MKRIVSGLLIYALVTTQAMAQATLVPNAKQTFLDSSGNPLDSGSVTMYVPGSTNKKTTWQDPTQSANNQNPVPLDLAGRAVIFGQGNYRQVVKDKDGVVQWDSFTSALGSSQPTGATGTDTAPVGAVMAWSSFTLPINWAYANGQALARATYPDLLTAVTISSTTTSCINGSPTLSGFSDTSQMRVGAPIEATCIPTSTTIKSITNSSTIVVSNNAVSTATVTATVFNWGNGDGSLTFNVPDLRGRVPAGADAMGVTAANQLQVSTTMTTSSASASATVASATGLALGMQIINPNVAVGTTITAISGTTLTLSAPASGSGSSIATRFSFLTDAQVAGATGGTQSHVQATAELAAHAHSAFIRDPGHTHNINGSQTPANSGSVSTAVPGAVTLTTTSSFTGVHVNSVNGGSSGTDDATASTGSSSPLPLVQPTATINYIIKIKANTTGAGGVVSLGGMFGDIVCDATFLCAPRAGINTIGLAQQADKTMLANVSGVTATPLPITNSEWLDATIGTARGTLPYRGVSTWGALSIGANNTWLASNGTDAAWTALPVATNASDGISRPDGTTIVATAGVLTAVGAATTSVGVGVTGVASGTPGNILSVGAGPLLAQNTLTSLLDTNFSSAQGAILYRNASAWTALAPGISGRFLQTQGAGANVQWADLTGVNTLNGLSGNLSIANGNGIASPSAVGSTITLSADIANSAAFFAGTASKMIDASVIYQPETTTTYGTTTTLDFSTFYNTKVTLTGNITTLTCSNIPAGKSGMVRFIQDSSGLHTTTWCSAFKWASGVTGVLSTAANAVDGLAYNCSAANYCVVSLIKDVK